MPILKPTGLLQVPGLLGGRITTIVFDQGNSTWTCPAGVTNLLSVYGIGGEGVGDYWEWTRGVPPGTSQTYSFNIFTNLVVRGTTESTTGETWETLLTEIIAVRDTINAGSSGEERDWTGGGERYERYVDPSNNVDTSPVITDTSTKNPLRIRGGAHIFRVGGTPPDLIGPILYTDIDGNDGGVYIRIETVRDGRVGYSTTGFGFTFPGGQLSGSYPNTIALDPVPASHANVAVTPGQDYWIGNAGTLIISYISP